MPLIINTNIASLNAQRQLLQTGMELDQASERLSSGRRINTAGDDAAGFAISNRQMAQIRGLDQAVRNANDGISLIQTTEGALQESTRILQRMRELSVQAANSIYADADRATLNAEVQQLKAEIDRVAETTAFNGQTILDGTLGSISLQVGSEANENIVVTIGELNANNLGRDGHHDVVGAAMVFAIHSISGAVDGTNGILSINGQNVGSLVAQTNLGNVLDTINTAVSGVEVSSFIEVTATADGNGILRLGVDTMDLGIITLEGQIQMYSISGTGNMQELVDKINEKTAGAIVASLNDENRLQLYSENAERLSTVYTGGGSIANSGLIDTGLGVSSHFAALEFKADNDTEYVDIAVTGSESTVVSLMEAIGLNNHTNSTITTATLAAGSTSGITEGDIAINGIALSGTAATSNVGDHLLNLVAMINGKSDETGVVASTTALAASTVSASLRLNSVDNSEISIDLRAGGTATYASTGLVEANNASVAGTNINGVDISTFAGAHRAISVIDSALNDINSVRADLGAVNNRLDFTVSNLTNIVENTSFARSRIVDADFAMETAELSRAQILQRASQAILAQANARPEQVLSLLR